MNLSVERKSLSSLVVSKIASFVSANGLGPGDRLPSERQLAVDLGVGYGTIREAFKTLEAVGIVSRKPKIGTILQAADLSMLADISHFIMLRDSDDFKQLLDARRLLEINMLDMISDSASEDQFLQMDFAIREMEAAIKAGRLGTEEDIKFHIALLNATNNKFLRQFGSLLQEFFRDQRTKLLADESNVKEGLQIHRELVKCLREKNVIKARELMNKHLNSYVIRGIV